MLAIACCMQCAWQNISRVRLRGQPARAETDEQMQPTIFHIPLPVHDCVPPPMAYPAEMTETTAGIIRSELSPPYCVWLMVCLAGPDLDIDAAIDIIAEVEGVTAVADLELLDLVRPDEVDAIERYSAELA